MKIASDIMAAALVAPIPALSRGDSPQSKLHLAQLAGSLVFTAAGPEGCLRKTVAVPEATKGPSYLFDLRLLKLAATALGSLGDAIVEVQIGNGVLSIDAGEETLSNGKKRKRFRAKYPLASAESWSAPAAATATEDVELASASLAKVLASVGGVAADPDKQPNLGGVELKVVEGKLQVTATDGHRVHRVSLALPVQAPKSLGFILKTSLDALLAVLPRGADAKVTLRLGREALVIQGADGLDLQVTMSGQALPAEIDSQIAPTPEALGQGALVNRQELLSGLKRARLAANPEYPAVRLDAEPGSSSLRIRSRYEVNESDDSIPLDRPAPAGLSVMASIGYLSDSLGLLDAHEQVLLSNRIHNEAVFLAPDATLTSWAAVMPVRLEGF